MRAYLGRLAFIAVLVGLLGLAWGMKGTELGQDLAGGAELRYGVTRRVVGQLRRLQVWLKDVNDPVKVQEKKDRIKVIESLLEDAGGAEADKLKHEKADLEFAVDRDRLVEAVAELKRQERAVGAGAQIIRDRIDKHSMGGIEIRTLGSSRLLIRLPFGKRADESQEKAEKRFNERLERIQQLVEQQGVLKFHLAISANDFSDEYEAARKRAENGQAQSKKYFYVLPVETYDETVKKLREHGVEDLVEAGYLPWSDPNKDAGTTRVKKKTPRSPLLLERAEALDGTIVDRAYQRIGEEGWEIGLDLTTSGAGKFERVSGKSVNRQLAIVLDETCYSAPVIRNRISGGRAVISGSFSETEARNLATILTAGSLPVQIEFESRKYIGPSLGNDSISAGAMAFAVGTGAVVLFMLMYYLSGGVIAVFGLALNLLIVMGALAAFNAKLTLPGIAGILLTVGMAVDANVLIFERIREEKAKGRTLRLAIQAGFDRAFVTIIDSNLTTILTALILYWFGSGPMKGFAVTLIIGITASLFTALYVSRTLIEMLVSGNILSKMTMLKAIGETKIPFMKIRFVTYLLSVVVVGGALYAFTAYPDKYGIDFAGGTMLQVRLADAVPADEMRVHADSAMGAMQSSENERAAGQGRSPIDFGATRVQSVGRGAASTGSSEYLLMLRMDAYQLKEYEDTLSKQMGDKLDAEKPFPFEETIGQTVSEELGADAVRSVVFAVLVVFLYILLRFEFNPSFGVGAIVALVHDVSITIGALATADWLGIIPAKFDLTSIAAVLTILGYSLNDTIVVFDRIRETRLGKKDRPMKEIVDEAINAVLSRTVVTSVTTLLAATSLLVLGGDTTKGFALAMIVGVLAGTYSSSFIAAPIVVEWEKLKSMPRLKKTLAIGGVCVVVLAFGGLIFQSVRTYNEKLLEDEDKTKIDEVWSALNAYASRHDGEYPEDLGKLVPEYLKEGKGLSGAGSTEGVGYSYVTGLRQDDSADSVLMYTPAARLAYGGYIVFVDGRLAWMDDRRIEAAVRSTLNRYAGEEGRAVRNITATTGASGAE